MNQKAYSILFCALLASTFGHELRAKAAANPSFAAKVHERVASSEVCVIECDNSNTTINGNGSFIIRVNVTAGLFVAVNVTASAAVIIDVNTSTVVVLNGTTGAAVVIDLKTGTGVHISNGAWQASETSIQEYLGSFSVTVLINISGAVSFKVHTAPTAIMKEVYAVALLVFSSTAAEFQLDVKQGFQLLVTMCNRFILLINSSLKGLLELIGTNEIHLNYGLAEFLSLCEGLGLIFAKVTGGLLVAKGYINLAAIAMATNGAEVLCIVMLALLAAKIDIGTVLESILNDPVACFALIVQLGGGTNYGLTGLFKVIAIIVAFIYGKVGLEMVITIIIQFLAMNKNELSEAFNSTLHLLLEVVIKVGGTGLEGLQTILKALIAGNFIIKGVNISNIIKCLLSGIVQGKAHLLRVIVEAILKLTAIVSASMSLPMLMFVLIIHLNNQIGVELIKRIIAIEINIEAASGSILLGILKSVRNIPRLILGDSYKFLISLPVIGNMVKAVGDAVTACSNGEFSLKLYLNGWFKNLFKAFIQFCGIPLGVSITTMTNMKGIMNNCTSLYGAFNYTIKFA